MRLFSGLGTYFHNGIDLLLQIQGADIVRYRPEYQDENNEIVNASVDTIRCLIGGNAYSYSMAFGQNAMLNINEKDEKDIVICSQDTDLRETDYLIIQGMRYAMTNVKKTPQIDGVVAIVGFKLRTGIDFDWSELPNKPDDDLMTLGMTGTYNL